MTMEVRTIREDYGVTPADSILDGQLKKYECAVWRKFDQLKASGKLKVWGFIDASPVVDFFLCKVIGARPPGCVG